VTTTGADGPGAPSDRPDQVVPEIVEPADGAAPRDDGATGEQVSRPTKLIRIASMLRSLLEEARRAPLDDAGRQALREIHERSIAALEDILSDDLKAELDEVALQFGGETPSESELLVAQAQLVGWLEGLFHGIQATLFTQQVAAQRQFEEMRGRRALEPGQVERPPGAYL
jgi:hypothetical protein